MVHKAQPGPANRSGSNGRGDPRTAVTNGYSSENDSEHLAGTRPRYHREQPQPQVASKGKDGEDTPSIAVWKDVMASYTVCRESIERSRELRNGRVGREWSSVIERRVQWLTEDLPRISEALSRNKRLGGVVNQREFQAACRKQEDRLRQVQSKFIEYFIAAPSKVDVECQDGTTYGHQVETALRDVYEKCASARRAFCREVDNAVEAAKEESASDCEDSD